MPASLGAVLAVFGAVVLCAPATATALDSDRKGFAIFRLEASNGYSIIGFAASERADGRGDIGLIVSDERGGVLYGAPATVTPTNLEADLGQLGRISLDIAPSGKKRTLGSRCGEGPVTLEPNVYRGSFEFHGEEGYTRRARRGCPNTAVSRSISAVAGSTAEKPVAPALPEPS